jgi:hypothetical protein
MSVGYATSMAKAGARYSVLKGRLQDHLLALSRWRNANRPKGGPARKDR